MVHALMVRIKNHLHPGKTRRGENDASQSNHVHPDIDILSMRRQRVMVEGFVSNEGLNLYRYCIVRYLYLF